MVEIMDRVYRGEIKGMYILGENPAMSDPDVDHARKALGRLDHLVVQDIFLTETANYADVILPASAFPEKSGTVTNTNRQVQMGRRAVPPPGEAREDWADHRRAGPARRARLGLRQPARVFDEMKMTMRSLTTSPGSGWRRENSVTYPCLGPDGSGAVGGVRRRLPACRGAGALHPGARHPADEVPDDRIPDDPDHGAAAGTLAHRLDDPPRQRSGRGRTGGELLAAPVDPAQAGGGAGWHGAPDHPARHEVTVMARADRAVAPDMVFLPFAYVEAAANILTNPALDPHGKIPEFKYSAVRVDRWLAHVAKKGTDSPPLGPALSTGADDRERARQAPAPVAGSRPAKTLAAGFDHVAHQLGEQVVRLGHVVDLTRRSVRASGRASFPRAGSGSSRQGPCSAAGVSPSRPPRGPVEQVERAIDDPAAGPCVQRRGLARRRR